VSTDSCQSDIRNYLFRVIVAQATTRRSVAAGVGVKDPGAPTIFTAANRMSLYRPPEVPQQSVDDFSRRDIRKTIQRVACVSTRFTVDGTNWSKSPSTMYSWNTSMEGGYRFWYSTYSIISCMCVCVRACVRVCVQSVLMFHLFICTPLSRLDFSLH